MDEEEELENTLIGQQEEEAPAVNTGDALMGAGGLPASAFGQAPAVNPFSMEAAGQVNPMMQQQSLEAPVQPQVTFRDYDVPEPPRASALSVFTPGGEVKPGIDVNAITPSPTTLPAPSFVQAPSSNAAEAAQRLIDAGPAFTQGQAPVQAPAPAQAQAPALDSTSDEAILARRAEREAQFAPIAERPPEMGPMQYIDRRTGAPLDPEVVKRVQEAGMEGYLAQASFPLPQAPAPQDLIAPMGREETIARLGGRTLNEYLSARPVRTPGISGLKTDPQGRMIPNRPITQQPSTDSTVPSTVAQFGQTERLSFEDARRRARGQLAGRNPSASDINSLARAIQAAEPERLAELATQRAKDAADLKKSELAASFEPKELDIGGNKYIQYTPNYIQPVIEDTPEKTGLQATLENLQSDLTSGRLTQEEYDIAVRTATNAYIGREEPKGQTSSSEFENIITGAGAGDTPTVDATDLPQVKTGRGQARRGRPVETGSEFTQQQEADIQKVLTANPDNTRAQVIEAMQKAGKL